MIADGFGMNASTRALPKRYRAAAIANIGWIRRSAGKYFPKMYPVPTTAQQIPARGAFDQQLRMVPGSFIWGWDIALLSTAGGVTLPNLYILIVDPCNRTSLFQTFVNASIITNTAASRRPFVMNHPYEVTSAQGFIDVQIRNNNNSAVSVQFLLLTAAPSEAASVISPGAAKSSIAISAPLKR